MPGAAAGRLLLTIHHLAVDGVSWRILVPDLAAAWAAIARGDEPVAAGARDLVPALGAAACGEAQDGGARRRACVLERDAERAVAVAGRGRARSARAISAARAGQLTLTLPAAITGALLTRVPAAFHGGINDVLLTGLVLAVADWCRRRGAASEAAAVLLDLEGHGREEVFADVDLSRTVGWFTSLFPVRLDAGALDLDEALAGGPALGRALKRDQGTAAGAAGPWARLRAAALPQRARPARSLRAWRAPQIGFNYLGRFAAARGAADWSGGGRGGARSAAAAMPAMPLAHASRSMRSRSMGRRVRS